MVVEDFLVLPGVDFPAFLDATISFNCCVLSVVLEVTPDPEGFQEPPEPLRFTALPGILPESEEACRSILVCFPRLLPLFRIALTSAALPVNLVPGSELGTNLYDSLRLRGPPVTITFTEPAAPEPGSMIVILGNYPPLQLCA